MSKQYINNNLWLQHQDGDAFDYYLRSGIDNEANVNVGGQYTARRYRQVVNDFVLRLKAYGIWNKLDIAYLMKSGNDIANATNLRSGAFTSTIVGTFDSNAEGMKANGTPSENVGIFTGYIPNDHMTINDTHIAIYSTDDGLGDTNNIIDVGAISDIANSENIAACIGRANGNIISVAYANDGNGTLIGDVTTVKGLSVFNKLSATQHEIYKNKQLISSSNTVSGSLPQQDLVLFNLNLRGVLFPTYTSTSRLTFISAGRGLTSQNISDLQDIIEQTIKMLEPISGPLTNIYFGDSITWGVDDTLIQQPYRWTKQLSDYLGVIEDNKGINGSTLQDTAPKDIYGGPCMMDRASTDIPTYDLNVHNNMFISYGANDIGASTNYTAAIFENQLKDILDIAFGKGWPVSKIKVVGVSYIEAYGPAGSLTKTQDMRTAAENAAIAKGVQYIGVDQGMDGSGLSSDLIHPNETGYTQMFNYIKDQL